jgi:hypothetical protein
MRDPFFDEIPVMGADLEVRVLGTGSESEIMLDPATSSERGGWQNMTAAARKTQDHVLYPVSLFLAWFETTEHNFRFRTHRLPNVHLEPNLLRGAQLPAPLHRQGGHKILKTPIAVAVAVLAWMLAAAVLSAAPPPVFPLDEVRPGLTGYGLTVFTGTKVDTFGVEVLGIRHNVSPGGDVILVELSGHGLEIAAVAQGMSGSPVYIDGKLLGAVAFGWQGALRPIAGVTPAGELVGVSAQPVAPAMARSAASEDLSALFGLAADHGLAAALFADAPAAGWPAAPAALPLAGARVSAEELALALVPGLATAVGDDGKLPFGIYTMAAGEATGRAQAANTLTPGSACAVVLVSGDAQLGAIGTTSLVDGDRVVLMGHPFLQVGPVDLPLATAEVVTVFPSRVMSFKMASAGTVVGRVTHDQRAGLAGRLGEFATTVPVKVRVEDGAVVQQYAYEVALEPQLTPALAFWCVYSSLLASGDDASLQTVRYDLITRWRTAAGEELPPVRLSGITAGPGSVAAVGADWVPLLRLLMNSRHAALVPTAVEAVLRAQRPLDTVLIVGAQAPARVAPGESFSVAVDLEAWRGAPRRETITLTVPGDLAPGRYKLGVASATEFFAFDAQRAPGLFSDDNLEATLALLAVERSPSMLVAALVSPAAGFVAGGREFAHLPGSVRRALEDGLAQAATPTTATYVVRAERELDVLLQGYAVIELEIQSSPRPVAEEKRP